MKVAVTLLANMYHDSCVFTFMEEMRSAYLEIYPSFGDSRYERLGKEESLILEHVEREGNGLRMLVKGITGKYFTYDLWRGSSTSEVVPVAGQCRCSLERLVYSPMNARDSNVPVSRFIPTIVFIPYVVQ